VASGGSGELPDLRDFIRSRRAALAGFMEQGASLRIDGELLTVTPRSDIYVRYLTDNRNVIGDLASELYGRRIKVEMAGLGAGRTAISDALAPAGAPGESSAANPERPDTPEVKGSAQGTKGSAASAESRSVASQDARQKLHADPLVQRIFQEFDARLVDLKTAPIRPEVSAPSPGKK
jgi:hypothetical protein